MNNEYLVVSNNPCTEYSTTVMKELLNQQKIKYKITFDFHSFLGFGQYAVFTIANNDIDEFESKMVGSEWLLNKFSLCNITKPNSNSDKTNAKCRIGPYTISILEEDLELLEELLENSEDEIIYEYNHIFDYIKNHNNKTELIDIYTELDNISRKEEISISELLSKTLTILP